MDLTLVRSHLFEKCTIGDLAVDGQRECYVLEDKVREISNRPVTSWKVQNQTAIPYGRYRVIIDFSKRFGRTMPHILDVPGFEGIRIHSGNTDVDTDGCLLLGQTWNPGAPDFVGGSRAAFAVFFPHLEAALSRGEECWIEITPAVPPAVTDELRLAA